VLPGHTETHSVSGAIWPNLKAGTVIMGAGRPGASNAPRVTLSHTGASMALNVADVVVCGLDIRSATAALTAAIVVTGAGCVFSRNRVLFTGALGANPPIAVTGAADFVMEDNRIIVDSTDPIVEVTLAATTNFLISRNFFRQTQGSSGGAALSLANTDGISGVASYNLFKSATDGTISQAFLGGAALGGSLVEEVALLENRSADGVNNNQAVIDPIVETA
jgi:hypothetical protein